MRSSLPPTVADSRWWPAHLIDYAFHGPSHGMRLQVLTLIVAAALCAGEARPACASDAAGPLSGYAMAQWTVNEGVPLGAVYAIVQSNDGYLWLATAGGVVRFDGGRFTPWSTLYADQLPDGAVLALRQSPNGVLWIGLDGDGHGATTVRALSAGRLLVTDAGTPPRGRTTCLFPDRSGAVWAVSSGTLYRLRNGRWDAFTGGPLPAGEVVSVGERTNGELWIGTRDGLFKWDRTRDSFALLETGIVREFSEGPDGGVWVTDSGRAARRLDAKQPPADLEGLGNRLLHDRRGNVWVATTGRGLWRIRDAARSDPRDPLVVEHITAQTGLSSDVVETLFEDREGNIWVGTTQGLHSLTPQVLTPLSAGAFVRSVLADADGTVWAGTANGLVRFRRRADTWAFERAGSTGIDINHLSRDPNGRLRIETRNGHTVQGPALGAIAKGPAAGETPAQKRTYGGREVVLEYRGADGDRFSALEDGALLIERADGSQSVIAPRHATGDAAAVIDAIYEDRRGTVWVGGTRGLCRVADTLVCPQNDGRQPEWRTLAMIESADGDLWQVVDRGPIFVGRRAALVRVRASDPFLTNSNPRAEYVVYDAGQGLAGAALGASIVRASDGTLWVVTGGYLTVVDPQTLPPSSTVPVPNARIEGASIDGEHVATTALDTLSAGTRRVEINYTALRLTAPRQLRFRYKLDGFDADWVEAGTRRQAYYTNLAPGEYTFSVAASGEGNSWTVPATWKFRVRPMFYQTAWFYSLVVLAVAIATWGAWRTRLWFLQRQFTATIAERTRVSREIHDTMLQSLAGIALQCQAIATRLGFSATPEREDLLALRRDVEQHIREARQAVMDLRSPLLEKRGLAGALDEVGRRLVNGRPITLEMATPGFHADQVSPDVERELLRIGQEAISNAIHHGRPTRIRVDLRHESGRVRLRVSDNGGGFDVQSALSNVNGHYGVVGMRERAARLGGALVLTSTPQRGTLVDVHVPAAATSLAS
jgi:signal transduction histidine kinase/ligand-binding sensor domain-containing protein